MARRRWLRWTCVSLLLGTLANIALAVSIAVIGVELAYVGIFEPPGAGPRWRYAIAAGRGAAVV